MTRRHALAAGCLAAVLLISVLDGFTPAGVVVGILLCLPILAASLSGERKLVIVVAAASMAGFVVAAWLGRGPLSPPAIWLPNRIFVFLTLPATAAMSLYVQQRRREALRARDSALAARDLNRILLSLLAHDLRSPLLLAEQAFEYVERALARGETPDPALLSDTRARLRRTLRGVEVVLGVAAAEAEALEKGPAPGVLPVCRPRDEITREVHSFELEARARGKRIELETEGLDGEEYALDGMVLRQALTILVDNALRYAVPGAVHVRAAMDGGSLVVTVADGGPGTGGDVEPAGSGVGLQLSTALVRRAGGTLRVDGAHGGTTCILSLPVAGVAARS